VSAAVDAHTGDATDAHDASAISNVAAGTIVATNVQDALNELDTEKQPLLEVKNTSGGARIAGEMVYTVYIASSGMEAKSPASASVIYSTSAAVVVIGGANNADIKVTTRGRFSIFYSGTAPSQGDFLILGAANTVTRQMYMSAEVIAIAMAAGSGGSVDAMLLTGTTPVVYSSANSIIQNPNLLSDSDFNGTIATLPGGAVLTYNVTSGDEGWLDAVNASALGKLRLYNSTQGTYALISDTVIATNTITLTANVPGGWATTDAITIRSQTNTDTVGGAYFLEYEITTEVPALARSVIVEVQFLDLGGVASIYMHPYEAFALAKASYCPSLNVGAYTSTTTEIPLIDRRFTIRCEAFGSGTSIVNVYLKGFGVASP